MCKENKRKKKKKVKEKERKEKVPKKNKLSLLLKEQLLDPSIDVLQV
jgi:hypothetical protein